MAKSVSPSKSASRGRGKAKSVEPKDRSKSRGRPKKESRGRSPTPKGARGRKSSVRRSTSKPRGRSQSRKSEPKPRARSSSRKSSARPRASTPSAEKEVQPPKSQAKVQQRRVLPTREASKPKASAASATSTHHEKTMKAVPSKMKECLRKVVDRVKNFGYRRTASALWWMVTLPLFTLGLHLLCSKDKCYIRFDPTIPKTLKVYVDPVVISYGTGLVLLQCLLSAIPIGRIVHGFGYRRANYQYRSNSFFCLVVSMALFCLGVFYFRWPNTQILQTQRFKCVCGATVIALLFSLVLYAKSFKTSHFHLNHGSQCGPGIQNNHLHDFVHGREISPKIGKTFDLGLVVLRAASCVWVLAILSACLQARADGPIFGLSYNVAVVAGMQLVYVMLRSLNEVHLLKSALIQQGVGFFYVFTEMVLTPFCATLHLRYLVESKSTSMCLWCYPGIIACFLAGLVLIHYSNALKYNNARFGGKVLRSGPWAFVRHPNYLGELMTHLAWTLPCGQVFLPYAHFIFTVLFVICRSRMVEKNTNADYRSYQNQVKSRVLPFIY